MSMHDYADMEICILRLAFLPVTKAHVQIYFIFAKNIVWLEHVFDFLAIENLPYSFNLSYVHVYGEDNSLY